MPRMEIIAPVATPGEVSDEASGGGHGADGATRRELQMPAYKIQATSYELHITNYELRITFYVLRPTSGGPF